MENEKLPSYEVVDRLTAISSELLGISQLLEGIQEVNSHEHLPGEQLMILERLTLECGEELRKIAGAI